MQEENEQEDFKQPDEYFEYNLVGVLVHSGTGESGHYYSYIQDRQDFQGRWYEFNDVHISEFNIANLKSECFGGEYENFNKSGVLYDWDNSKSRNAYILFYERKKPF